MADVNENLEETEGYKPVAVRDDITGNTVISFNTDKRDFILAVSGKLLGPITAKELAALSANIVDVLELKGRFLFIEDYDVHGNQK